MKGYVRSFIFIGSLAGMAVLFSRCSGVGSSGSSGSTPLTTAGKITSGLGSATTTLQSLGGALANGNSSFSTGGNHIQSPATSCTSHGDPGSDANLDGSVSDSERYFSNSSPNFALQKFYCTLAANTNGPESVSGAVRLIKTVSCAIEKQLGSITFNNVPVSVSSLTIDTRCATAAMLEDMNGNVPTTSITMSIPLTITAALTPSGSNFPEV